MLSRLACIALLVWPACAWALDTSSRSEKAREKLEAQTKTEARLVLAALLRDAKAESTLCHFDERWSSRPVDALTAQKHLGLTLNVDVIAPDLGTKPRELIDPDDKVRDAFCSDQHAGALWRQMLDDFRSGASPGNSAIYGDKPHKSGRLSLSRAEITMPVFDRTFTTAIVVAGFTTYTTFACNIEDVSLKHRLCTAAGYYRYVNVEGIGYTYVYRKRGEHWRQIEFSQDWTLN